MSWVFHAALVLVDVAALAFLARRPGVLRLLAAVFATGLAGWILATILGRHFLESGFAYLRFLALGVAVHGPLVLGVAAWILRREQRVWAWTTAVLALIVAGAAVDAFQIEPRWLEVSRHTLTSPKIEKPVRIVVLADYQTDAFGPYERRVWDTAHAQGADLVLLPGDYLQVHDEERRLRLREETRDYLRRIRFGEGARLGAFAVVGDVDYGDARWAELFDGTPVTAIKGGTRTIELPELTLTALEVRDSRSRTVEVPSSPRFHVVFGHAPDFALNGVDADLQIAGHTHGGQLRVPGLGPLLTFSRVPRSWAAGVTDLGGGRTLVVSRGVGLERGRAPRLRFLCRPEIVVLDVEPEAVSPGEREGP